MPGTLTFFFCGTQATSNDAQNDAIFHAGELVSTLFQNCQGANYMDKVIFDGPGSGNLRENEKWIQSGLHSDIRGTASGAGWENNVQAAVAVSLAHVRLGSYSPSFGVEIQEGALPYWIPDMQRQACKGCNKQFGALHRKHHCRKCGEIFCKSCLKDKKQIAHVITDQYTVPGRNDYLALKPGNAKVCRGCFNSDEESFLTEMANQPGASKIQDVRADIAAYRQKEPLTTINTIGWSRGGVTCIMFANACAKIKELDGIKINLFTIDPVPGHGSGGGLQTSQYFGG